MDLWIFNYKKSLDALIGYTKGETNEEISLRAAKAYNKYQKCGLNEAKNLLVTN